jgi:hypothetical protein
MAWTAPSTHVPGTMATVAMMNAQVRDNLNWLNDMHGVRLQLSSDETITTGTVTAIPWDAEDYDTDGFWAVSPNPTRLTIPANITAVRLSLNIAWASESAGDRYIEITKNGSAAVPGICRYDGDAGDLNGANLRMNTTTPPLVVVATDYFEATVWHDRGSNLAVSDSNRTWFGLRAVGYA